MLSRETIYSLFRNFFQIFYHKFFRRSSRISPRSSSWDFRWISTKVSKEVIPGILLIFLCSSQDIFRSFHCFKQEFLLGYSSGPRIYTGASPNVFQKSSRKVSLGVSPGTSLKRFLTELFPGALGVFHLELSLKISSGLSFRAHFWDFYKNI